MKNGMLVACLVGLLASNVAMAEESVKVSGSGVRFPARVERNTDDGRVGMVLTGVGLRERFFLNVYAIGSYVDESVEVRGARHLATVDANKALTLVMERNVSAQEMMENVTKMIRANHPAPAFDAEVAQLAEYMTAAPVRDGYTVWLSHLPGKGFRCKIGDREPVLIPNPDFSQCIWDIYLGPKNLGSHIKRGLVQRL